MIGNIEKKQIDVSRRLKDTAYALKVYGIWAILAFLLFGLMGIYPQARNLYKELSMKKELESVNASLAAKIDQINHEDLKIKSNAGSVGALENNLPSSYEVQNYIVDLSFAATQVGYNLTRLQAQKSTDSDQKISVLAEFEGSGNIGELSKSMESLKRAAQLDSLKFVEITGKKKVDCMLSIYIF